MNGEPSLLISVQIKPTILSEAPSQSTIDEICDSNLLRHVEDMPGTNSCIYYVERAFTFLPYDDDDASPTFIPFMCSREVKIWCVANRASQTLFERVVATILLKKDYLNDHNGDTCQILETKNIFLIPRLFLKISRKYSRWPEPFKNIDSLWI